MEEVAPLVETPTQRGDPTSEPMADAPVPTAVAAMEGQGQQVEAAMPTEPWMSIPLTEVTNGREFRVSDYTGKVVLVETMAIWCSKCRTQQEHIRTLHGQLGAQAADLVSITLDVDPHEDAPYLKSYVEQTGFDWIYAISPAELSRELAGTYGDLFLNPPSTPILIIDRSGAAHALPYGIKSAGDLQQTIQPFLDAGA